MCFPGNIKDRQFMLAVQHTEDLLSIPMVLFKDMKY